MLVSTKGLGQYISGAILFEETLYQSGNNGRKMVDMLTEQGIVPGIKVDKGLAPLANSNGGSVKVAEWQGATIAILGHLLWKCHCRFSARQLHS
eukprot:scaffold326395_cov33-Tisochrysis_lutea.AAC.1